MTAKIDGTNGVLQAYDYQVLTTGFSYTFAAGTQMLIANPAGTLATGTVTMPASPADGMVITFSSSQQITALTLQGNTGQSISSAVTFLPAQTAVSYVYRLANTTWYPCQTVPGTGSQLSLSTTQNTTSGTAINFTNVPSWVRRITFMFNGVSTNGTSILQLQLGTGATPTYVTSGYTGTFWYSGGGGGTFTTGIGISASAVTNVRSGAVIITSMGSNLWVATGAVGLSDVGITSTTGAAVSLGAALTAIRLTTVNGTDAFDLGSVNILYE